MIITRRLWARAACVVLTSVLVGVVAAAVAGCGPGATAVSRSQTTPPQQTKASGHLANLHGSHAGKFHAISQQFPARAGERFYIFYYVEPIDKPGGIVDRLLYHSRGSYMTAALADSHGATKEFMSRRRRTTDVVTVTMGQSGTFCIVASGWNMSYVISVTTTP